MFVIETNQVQQVFGGVQPGDDGGSCIPDQLGDLLARNQNHDGHLAKSDQEV